MNNRQAVNGAIAHLEGRIRDLAIGTGPHAELVVIVRALRVMRYQHDEGVCDVQECCLEGDYVGAGLSDRPLGSTS